MGCKPFFFASDELQIDEISEDVREMSASGNK